MADTKYGPKNTCMRTACAELEPHLAGRHLDQRDELYDGPSSLLQVLPLAVRDSAYKIVREAPALMPEVVDLAKHIEFLREQIAHLHVDKDRSVSNALALATNCEQHGKDIERLNEQLHHFERESNQNNNGRLAVLGLLHQIEDFLRGYDEGRIKPDVPALVAALRKVAKQTHDAHQRAWKK